MPGIIQEALNELSDSCQTILAVGFGATGMLLQAIYDYATPYSKHIIFIKDMDDHTINMYAQLTAASKIVIASISGNTTESILYAEMALALGNKPIIITSTGSHLHNTAINHNSMFIPIGDQDRFSGLNNAALLLGAVVGLGAAQMSSTLASEEIDIIEENTCFLAPSRVLGILNWFIYVWGEHIQSHKLSAYNISDVIHGKAEVLKKQHNAFIVIDDTSKIDVVMPSKYLEVVNNQKILMRNIVFELSEGRPMFIQAASFWEMMHICTKMLSKYIKSYNNIMTNNHKHSMMQAMRLSPNA